MQPRQVFAGEPISGSTSPPRGNDGGMRLGEARTTAVLVAAAFAFLWLVGASARAATYTVWSCRGPDGAPISTAAWKLVGNDQAARDTCAGSGSLDAGLLQSDDQPLRGYRFTVAPGASVAGYRIYLHAFTADRFNGSALQAGVDDNDADLLTPVDAGCLVVNCTFGSLLAPLSPTGLIAKSGLNTQALTIAAVCGRRQGCQRANANGLLAEVVIFRAEVDVADDEPPVLLEPTGMPGSAQILSSESIVTAGASDRGGGVAGIALLVDGREVARHDAQGTCSQPYAQAVPCPGELTAALRLDLASLGSGLHTASIRAVDAAGNVSTGHAFTFSVGSLSSSLSASVSGATERPGASERPGVLERLTIRASREVIRLPDRGRGIAGVVKNAAGRPVAGARVSVRSLPFGVRRAKPRLERALTTDARGRFRTSAGRTSRLVLLDVNEFGRRTAEPAEIKVMRPLKVVARSKDRVLRNGSTLTLRASVTGADAGTAGKAVLVQVFTSGRWTTEDSLKQEQMDAFPGVTSSVRRQVRPCTGSASRFSAPEMYGHGRRRSLVRYVLRSFRNRRKTPSRRCRGRHDAELNRSRSAEIRKAEVRPASASSAPTRRAEMPRGRVEVVGHERSGVFEAALTRSRAPVPSPSAMRAAASRISA